MINQSLNWWSSLLIIIVLSLNTTLVRAQEESLKQSFDTCRLLAAHHPVQARQSILKWQSLQNSTPYILACEGITWFYQQKFSKAALLLEKAAISFSLEQRTEKTWSYTSACWGYFRAQLFSDAVRTCTHAIQLYPNDVELRIDRSFAYVEQKLYEKALADLNFVVQHAPNHAKAYQYRSALYLRLGRLKPALSDVHQALNLLPQNPQSLLLRANILYKLGATDKAIEDWKLILSTAPKSPSAQQAQYHLQNLQNKQ